MRSTDRVMSTTDRAMRTTDRAVRTTDRSLFANDYETLEITCEVTKSLLRVKQRCLPGIVSNVTKKQK